MNKNVEQIGEGKLYYAVVLPYKGKGEPKLLLHEAHIDMHEAQPCVAYGAEGLLVIDPSAVTRVDRDDGILGPVVEIKDEKHHVDK